MLARRATTAVCAILSLVIACNSFSSEPVKLSDDQLRKSIVGVWFAEDMRDLKMHVGQRMQYFSDGHFVGDFRISGPGHERYLRSLGVWSVTDGKFSETAEQTSDPEIKFPSFFRYVVSVDVIFFGLTACCIFVFRRREPPAVTRVPGHPFTTITFIAVCWIVAINTVYHYPQNTLIGIAIMIAGIPAYWFWQRRSNT